MNLTTSINKHGGEVTIELDDPYGCIVLPRIQDALILIVSLRRSIRWHLLEGEGVAEGIGELEKSTILKFLDAPVEENL